MKAWRVSDASMPAALARDFSEPDSCADSMHTLRSRRSLFMAAARLMGAISLFDATHTSWMLPSCFKNSRACSADENTRSHC